MKKLGGVHLNWVWINLKFLALCVNLNFFPEHLLNIPFLNPKHVLRGLGSGHGLPLGFWSRKPEYCPHIWPRSPLVRVKACVPSLPDEFLAWEKGSRPLPWFWGTWWTRIEELFCFPHWPASTLHFAGPVAISTSDFLLVPCRHEGACGLQWEHVTLLLALSSQRTTQD